MPADINYNKASFADETGKPEGALAGFPVCAGFLLPLL
jgi:hypothetical protein